MQMPVFSNNHFSNYDNNNDTNTIQYLFKKKNHVENSKLYFQ